MNKTMQYSEERQTWNVFIDGEWYFEGTYEQCCEVMDSFVDEYEDEYHEDEYESDMHDACEYLKERERDSLNPNHESFLDSLLDAGILYDTSYVPYDLRPEDETRQEFVCIENGIIICYLTNGTLDPQFVLYDEETLQRIGEQNAFVDTHKGPWDTWQPACIFG